MNHVEEKENTVNPIRRASVVCAGFVLVLGPIARPAAPADHPERDQARGIVQTAGLHGG